MTRIGLGVRLPHRRGLATGFQPTKLPDLQLWLRGDLGITLNGADVSAWADQSGQGNHFVQATEADQPVYDATNSAFNDQATLQGDAVSEHLESVGFTIATALDVFFVADAPPGPVAGIARWGASVATPAYPWNDGNVYIDIGSTVRQTVPAEADVVVPHYLEVISTSAEWTARITGVEKFTTGTNTFAWDAGVPRLFSSAAGDTYWAGTIAEVIAYDRKLSAAERAEVEAYIGARYGL